MDGGTFQSTYISTYAQYLLKCLQGFSGKGISVYAISIQVSVNGLYSHVKLQ